MFLIWYRLLNEIENKWAAWEAKGIACFSCLRAYTENCCTQSGLFQDRCHLNLEITEEGMCLPYSPLPRKFWSYLLESWILQIPGYLEKTPLVQRNLIWLFDAFSNLKILVFFIRFLWLTSPLPLPAITGVGVNQTLIIYPDASNVNLQEFSGVLEICKARLILRKVWAI